MLCFELGILVFLEDLIFQVSNLLKLVQTLIHSFQDIIHHGAAEPDEALHEL